MNQRLQLQTKVGKAKAEMEKGNYLKSITLCKKILAKDNQYLAALKLLSTNLIKLRRFSEAEQSLKKAIKLSSDTDRLPLTHLLGCNYISLRQFEDALNVLEGLFNETGDSNILLDIALTYQKLANYEAARQVYLKLLELQPDNHQAKFNLYPILLKFKDYKNAWACFHSRLHRQEIIDQVHWFATPWAGEPLTDKTVLIYPEQGIGDNLAYTSCFKDALDDAKEVHIVCDNRLKSLFQYNYPSATIHSYQDVNNNQAIKGQFDCQILAGSLSYLYRPDAASFANEQLLKVENKLVQSIADNLAKDKLRIGLSWFHGRINDGNEFSMYLEELLPLLKIEGIEWVNLQFGEWQKESKRLAEKHGINIVHLEQCSAAGDFNHYAGLIANLDLVISASNAAHMLASRLGVKNWMFLPGKKLGLRANAGQDSLANKGTSVFYKEQDETWQGVVASLCNQLKALPELAKQRESA